MGENAPSGPGDPREPYHPLEVLERSYPLHATMVYAALITAVPRRFAVRGSDAATLTCIFSSSDSELSRGEDFLARIVAADGGAVIKVRGAGRIGGQIQKSDRTVTLMNGLFDDVKAALRDLAAAN